MDSVINFLSGDFTQADGNLLINIQQHVINDAWTPAVRVITSLGNAGIVWIALIVLLLLFKKTRKAGIVAACALALSFCVNNLFLKELVGRTRPYDMFSQVQLLVERQTDPSFPSGHSAASFSSAVAMCRNLPKWAGALLLLLAFMISLSRLYVGVHYPSDVLVGALSGTICALIVTGIFNAIDGHRNSDLKTARHYKK